MSVAQQVLEAVGGSSNVEATDVCMTRLRLVLANPSLIDETKLSQITGVLGTLRRGDKSFEIVFGPAMIQPLYKDFSKLVKGASTEVDLTERPQGAMRVVISPARHRSYRAQAEALRARSMASEGIASSTLDDILTGIQEQENASEEQQSGPEQLSNETGNRLLVINGPNINLLGLREPAIYGNQDYPALIELCRQAATEAGFASMRYFQSNYEGAIVDEIQQAYGSYDGIIINPAAYTHTSIAILDALKAVRIPAVEVHISKVDEREPFRQVSYIRDYCIDCVAGLGIEGYRTAIFTMASYLKDSKDA